MNEYFQSNLDLLLAELKRIELKLQLKVDQKVRRSDSTLCWKGAYEFEPSGIKFNKQVNFILGYDVKQLPEHVKSIALAYYSTESGWVYLKAESGVVAGLVKITAPVDHFTILSAILAEAAPAPTPLVPPQPSKPFPWWIILVLIAILIVILWLLRKYVLKLGIFS